MNIFRSIAGVVVGCLVAVVFITVIETANSFMHPPPGGMSVMEFAKEMEKGTPAAKEWMNSIPLSAMALLQVGWGVGALVGGAVSAWIAGRARLVHAGFIGAFVLAGTIFNVYQLKTLLDFTLPDWLLVTGLLLPLPLSLLGGVIVAKLCDAAPPPPPTPPETPA